MTTGEKIKSARQKAGYTQEQLAEKLLVSRQAIAKWEADRGVPDIENLQVIAKHFELSVDDLLNPEVEIGNESTVTKTAVPEISVEPVAATPSPGAEAPEANNKKPVRKKVTLLITAGVSALGVLIVLLATVVVPSIQESNLLKKAETLMTQGAYVEALEILSGINTSEAGKKELDYRYAYANELYKQGKYAEALAEIRVVLTYKDAEELYNHWTYEYAMHCVKQNNYTQAITLLAGLGNYKDAGSRLNELHAYYGCILFQEQRFEEAISQFEKTSFKEYFHTAKAQAQYNRAVELYNKGQYGLAYNAFNRVVKNYPNVSTVENLQSAPYLAKDTLQKMLLAGMGWTKTSTYNYGNTKASISFAITSSMTQIVLNDVENGQHIGRLEYNTGFDIPNDTLREAGINEVFVGGITDSDAPIVLTFSFSSNSRVTIHYNDAIIGECDDIICGIYELDGAFSSTSETMLELVFKNQQLNYISLTPPMFTLSFLDELSSEAGDEKEDIGGTDGTSSGTGTTTSFFTNDPTSIVDAKTTTTMADRETTEQKNTSKSMKPTTTSRSKTTTTTKDPCSNGHKWKPATCEQPATCSVCQKTSGQPLEHTFGVVRCKYCGYVDFSLIAQDYTDISAYDATTGEEYDVQNVSLSASGVFSFTFNGERYDLTLVYRGMGDRSEDFDCYINGVKEPDAVVEVDTYIRNPRLSWKYLNGCNLYIYAE